MVSRGSSVGVCLLERKNKWENLVGCRLLERKNKWENLVGWQHILF